MKKISCLILVIGLLGQGCDTDKNIAPNEYFLKYYGLPEGDQLAVDLAHAADGHNYLLGTHVLGTVSDLFIVKTDKDGNSIWEKTYTNADRQLVARDIEILSDGNLVVVANVVESGETDFLILKINSSDGTETQRKQDGYPGTTEIANSVTEISDGFIVSGSTTNTQTPASAFEGFWFRYNADLSDFGVTWSKQINLQDQPQALGSEESIIKTIETSPGVFYMFGSSNRPDNLDDQLDHNFLIFTTNNFGIPIGVTQAGFVTTDERMTTVTRDGATSGFLIFGMSYDNAGGVGEAFAARVQGDSRGEVVAVTQQRTVTSTGINSSDQCRVVGIGAKNGDYLVVSSDNSSGSNNIFYSRLNSRLQVTGSPDYVAWGGIGEDIGASVAEDEEGRTLILGTMVLGDVNGQKKLVLIRVSRDGKFAL